LIEADNGIEIQAMLNAFKHDFGSNTVESLPIKKKKKRENLTIQMTPQSKEGQEIDP